MSDQSDNPEREDAPAGADATDQDSAPETEGDSPADQDPAPAEATAEPRVVDPDTVTLDAELSEASIEATTTDSSSDGASGLEPSLSTTPEELQLSEPSLAEAKISEESAAAASLHDAAAEAQAVGQEAEQVGTLLGGPAPADQLAEPAGTAPAGGKAGDVEAGALEETAPEKVTPEKVTPEKAAPEDVAPETSTARPPVPLPSYAASGEDPAWTNSTTEDQARWDTLFEQGTTGAARTDAAPTDGDAPTRDDDTDAPSNQASEAAGHSTESPSLAPSHDDGSDDDEAAGTTTALPPGIPAPPAGVPGPPPVTPPTSNPGDGDGSPAREGSAPPASSVPEAPWGQPFAGPHPQSAGGPAVPVGGAYGLPPSGSDQGPGGAHPAGPKRGGLSRRTMIILAVAGVVVLGLLIFGIVRIVDAVSGGGPGADPSASPTPGADGIIAEDVSPLDLAAGTCVLDFNVDDVDAEVTTVTCSTPHNAQLLATESYADDDEFPGDEALAERGNEICDSATIDQGTAADYPELTLTTVTPTSGTWAEGDRRVDCYVVSSEGNTITDTLLAE